MDVWGNIYIGKRWVEDDGSTKVEIQNTKEWHIKTSTKVRVEPTPQFRVHFTQIGMEVARTIALQLEQMRDELLYLVEHGIKAKEAKDAENQDTENDQG